MDNQKFLLIIALGIILFLIFQAWQQEHQPAPAPEAKAPA